MFYNVRIFDADMNIKKVITSQELTRRFWRQFYQEEKKHGFTSSGRDKISHKTRKKLIAQFPDLYDPSYLNPC